MGVHWIINGCSAVVHVSKAGNVRHCADNGGKHICHLGSLSVLITYLWMAGTINIVQMPKEIVTEVILKIGTGPTETTRSLVTSDNPTCFLGFCELILH